MTTTKFTKVVLPWLMILAAIFTAWNNVNAKVAVLESKTENIRQLSTDIATIKADIKHILKITDRLHKRVIGIIPNE